ncbi:Polysulphide reductase NrfD [Anaeromyxobacter dehalogenans 2CP-1]|uniref:Polysulphide reductase NrfD n=1 Tax=Anaeromyxobacter dehalogenans (strain ATCC BAA-258 / DSM 21875 / 2CP-1) TaxID=455488 RepID=B8JCC1_ANAD2|nr:NrfD/PsrC family molybdoenzyme membrane anchor subunit [Anaeromyxobacter dehalogenans]ACL65861.1 Polysulphide reductase NrfD [Anaeromyxobacter dehalogenans 2CP-1]
MSGFLEFVKGCVRQVLSGGRAYKAWMAFLLCVIAVGVAAYTRQATAGLIASNMRDDVSWAFYIGNFAFLVGVAAAAVLLVIPAYVYQWKPIKEVVVLGELLAISALVMALLFISVDLGRPDRVHHMMPFLGTPNWPASLLTWDALVLNTYLLLNVVLVLYLLFKTYRGEHYDKRIFLPLVLLSIPVSISTHTVTAFLFNGMAARPYWNASILAPRFIASALCSGPAVMIILFQLLRKAFKFEIKDEAIWKIAELMAYAMFINLFLLGAELFKEYYSATEHLLYTKYLWGGIGEHTVLVKYAWLSLACSVIAFLLFLTPRTRKNFVTLNVGCVLIWAGVYIEKGMGLIIPGFTPSTLGQIYEYTPTKMEWAIAAGVFGVGFLTFTILVKIAVPILVGTFRAPERAHGHAPAAGYPVP